MRSEKQGPQWDKPTAVFLLLQFQAPDLIASCRFGRSCGKNERDLGSAGGEDHGFWSRWSIKNLALGNDASFEWIQHHNLSTADASDRISRRAPGETASDTVGKKARLGDRTIQDVDTMQLR